VHAKTADVDALLLLDYGPGISGQHLVYLFRKLVLLLACRAAGTATNAARKIDEKSHTHGFSCFDSPPREGFQGNLAGSMLRTIRIVNPLVANKNGIVAIIKIKAPQVGRI
jgi:hypothetical protein